MQRILLLFSIAAGLVFALAARAEDAAELRAQGIQALNESQTTPSRIVDAARFFVKAEELYDRAREQEKAVEMNSFLYWCKKKMTLEDIERFTAGGEAAVAVKLKAVEEMAPKPEDAQVWFERAEKFARGNPDQHFLIAVRYFEVASRFVGSDISIKAQELSLNEQALANNQKPAAPVAPAKPAVDPATLRAVPAAEKLAAAEKLIKDLLKADFANADAAGRIALYGKLIQQADENKNDAAAEYVLLREARDAAVLAGDGARAIQAQARLKGAFKIDAAALAADLQRLAKSARSPEAAAAMAMLLAAVGDEALAAENYEQAVRAYLQAEEMLPLVKDAAFKAKLKSDSARAQTLKRESVAAAAALKTLATKPDDAAANLVEGKFMLLRGDLGRSFALLAKSGDAQWSSLGKHEQAPPTDAEQQVLLGDEWFERMGKEAGLMKERVQERAKYWYEAALPNLAGLGKLKVEGQLKKMAPSPATGTASAPVKTNAKTVDLLKLVDPAKDSVAGQWKMQDGALLCTSLDRTQRIELPYKPGAEYDLHCVLSRQDGNDDIGLYLVSNDQKIMLSLCGWANSIAGLRNINGKEPNMAGNPTKTKNSIVNGKDYDFKVFVRKSNIRVLMNDKELFNYKFETPAFTPLPGYLNLHDEKALGLYTSQAAVKFTRIEVVEQNAK
ncbi:MAG TPA: hypothetical protein VKX17_10955 [Planctomycetota bacterium]|nr:hypothetical protein [Planctomycetota bacterium]